MSSSSCNSTDVLVAQLSTTESILESLFSEFSSRSAALPTSSSYAPTGNLSPRSPVPSPAPPGRLADSDDTINDDEVEVEVLSIDKKDPEVEVVSPPTPVPASPPGVLTTAVLGDKLARMEECVWQIPSGEVELTEQWTGRVVQFWKRFQSLKSNEQLTEKHSRIEQRLRTIDMIIWKLFERNCTLLKPVSGLIRNKLDALEEAISDISLERAELAKQWQVKLAQWWMAFVERGGLDSNANTSTDSTGSYILVDSNDTNRTAQENDFGHLVTTNSNSNAATVTAARFENQENGSGFGDDEDTQGEEEEEQVDNDSRMGDGSFSPHKRTRRDDDDEVEVKYSELQRQQQQNQAYGSYDVVASKAQLRSEAHKAFGLIRPIRGGDLDGFKVLLQAIANTGKCLLRPYHKDRELKTETFHWAYEKLPLVKQNDFYQLFGNKFPFTNLVRYLSVNCLASSMAALDGLSNGSQFAPSTLGAQYVCCYCLSLASHKSNHCPYMGWMLCVRCFDFGHIQKFCKLRD